MNTASIERRPLAGVGVTLWTGGDLARALPDPMANLLDECRPPIVCVHAGPDRLDAAAPKLVARVRRLVPNVRIQLGIGCDYWFGTAMTGSRAAYDKALDELAAGAHLAASLGAEAAIWDAEAAMKANSAIAHNLAGDLVARVRVECPALIQGHTAYDHPTLHSDDADGQYDDGHTRGEYAWRGWLQEGGVDWEVAQNYVALEPSDGSPAPPAPRGALARRVASSDASFARAQQLGWVRAGLPIDRYFQAHGVPFAQTATCGAGARVVLLWCGPRMPAGRLDVSGEYALRILCALDRAGYRQPGGIAAWQRARGLPDDGIAGRATAASLGIHVPADVP